MTAMQKAALALFFIVTFAGGIVAVASGPPEAPEPHLGPRVDTSAPASQPVR
jgi:hypothetical protein